MSINRRMDKENVAHIYNGILGIKRNEVELFVVRWMDLESVIQSEVSQKEKRCMLMHIYGILKSGTDEPSGRAGIKTQT